jgi:hypothetical protein
MLWPFVAIQTVTVGGIALLAAWLAVERWEAGFRQRLANVVATLENTTFPLTPPVLQQLQDLSNAEFIVLDSGSHVVESTLNELGDVSSELAEALPAVAEEQGLITIAGTGYYARVATHSQAEQPLRVLVLYPETEWRQARHAAMWPPLLIGGALLIPGVLASMWIAQQWARRILRARDQRRTARSG